MSNSNTLQVLDKLPQLKRDITNLARKVQDFHRYEYSKARNLVLNTMGFQNSYEFDRWYDRELALIESAAQCERRLAASRCANDVDTYEHNGPVYIFASEPSYFLYYEKEDSYESFKDVAEDIEYGGLTQQFGDFQLCRTVIQYSVFCSRYAGDSSKWDPVGTENRKASCSCKISYAYKKAFRYGNKPLYHLETAQDIVDWAHLWGGVAYFDQVAMDSLEKSHPDLVFDLMKIYLVRIS